MTRPLRILLAPALAAAVLFGTSAPALATPYAAIEGSGSTWSQVILSQWIADVSSSGMQVTYNGSGSSQGRKDFANGVTDFGISEIPYQGVDPITRQSDASKRPYAYLPIVAGGTAFTYQVKVAGKMVTNLRLSGETIAKIFTNKITNWNDPAITKDNNGHPLPSLPITPVVRSDGSGTTAQFTRYLDTIYPSIWRPYNGQAGLTSQFPRKGRQIAASGSDQVMNTIDGAAGNGTIGYIEYSYALNAHYPVVYVQNRSGYYVQPTQYNVAVALTKAQINQNKGSLDYLTQNLDGVYRDGDPRAYPISSYSYLIIPTSSTDQRMNSAAKRRTLADFLSYSLCAGQTKAGPYGYSPLPLNLVKAAFTQVEKLGPRADPTAYPGVSIKNPSANLASCNNPTFVKGNLSANHLAQVAPMPQPCQKAGHDPCGGAIAAAPGDKLGTGPVTATTTGTSGANATPGNPPAGSAVDPATGQATTGQDATASGPIAATAAQIGADRQGDNRFFGGVAVLELLAIILVPGLYVAWARRNRGATR